MSDGLSVRQLIEAGRDLEAARQGAHETGVRSANRPGTDGGPMDPLQQLDQLGPLLVGVVDGIRADQLDVPTPCARFTVRGVLEHMLGGAAVFAAAYRGTAPAEPDLRDPLASFPVALGELASAIGAPGALDRTIEGPQGPIDGASFARFIVLDGLVHGWDLATATGQPYDPPPALVAEVHAFAQDAVDPLRDGDTFGTAVEPAADASPIERLAAFTGRRPLAVAP
jgi:uncharacterized protein (TIGR03086 family)